MGPEGNILVNSSLSNFQQGLTHSVLKLNIETTETCGTIDRKQQK